MIIEVNKLEEGHFIEQLIREKDTTLIHGKMSDAKKVTAVVSEQNKKIRMSFVSDMYNERLVFEIRWLFYDEHFPSSDIKFKGLVVNFNGLNKWISIPLLVYSFSEANGLRSEVNKSKRKKEVNQPLV
jgi:hypothetical protein